MRKDYLQALANLASSRALPSDQVVFSSAVSNELSWNRFTAPADGIFYVGVQQFNIDIRNKTIPISYACWDNPEGWRGGWVPVRKGDVVEFKVWGGSSVGDKTYADCVAFIKTKASA